MSLKKTLYRFKCTKADCKIEYEAALFALEAKACPKCHDSEFVEVKGMRSDNYDSRRVDDYGSGY